MDLILSYQEKEQNMTAHFTYSTPFSCTSIQGLGSLLAPKHVGCIVLHPLDSVYRN